jgi:O-antigen ligase
MKSPLPRFRQKPRETRFARRRYPEDRSQMSPALIFGSLLAMYYFIGRWTFARLDGDYALTPMVEQPRFWLVAALAGMAVVIQCSLSRRARQFRLTGVDAATIAFLGYMLLTSLWGPDNELAYIKWFEVSLLLAVALVVAIARNGVLDDQVHVGFWATIVLIGLALGALSIVHGGDARAYAPGGGPNTFGRNMGLTAFGAAYLASRYGTFARIGSIGVIGTAAMLVVRSGSRGGLLSFGVAGAVYTVTSKMSIAHKALIVAAVGVATGLAMLYTDAGQQAIDVFTGRIVQQTLENRYLSGRDDLWLDALEMMRDRPMFGLGLDGFRANSWNYPHNIFLEVAVEGGAVGLLLLLNIPRAWLRHVSRAREPVSRTYLAALALTFVAAQTSGDLFDSRGVFLLVALSLPVAGLAARKALSSDLRPAALKPHRTKSKPSVTTTPALVPGSRLR